MLCSLSTENSIWLAGVASVFIAFSLISSFALPARNPNFPGAWRNAYVGVCVLLFAAMMATVLIFGVEEEHAGAEAVEHAGETQPTETQPAETGTETTPAAGGLTGDAAAGKVVFTSSGCGACHVLSAAGATGAVGPNLDEAKPSAELAHDRVVNGKGAMPPFGSQLSEKQIEDVVAFVVESTHGGG
jgi:mono/diheme cytochrome c family protein